MKIKSLLNYMTRINDICLFVPDIKKAVDFYVNRMKFNIVFQRQPYYVIFDFQGTALTVWDETEVTAHAIPAEKLGGAGRHFMIAVEVPHPGTVDEVAEELEKNGVECITSPRDYHWKCRAAYYQDIFGNIWEVFSEQEEAERRLT